VDREIDRAIHDYGIEPLANSIALENEGAFFKPLSRDADSLEGLNVHGAIIDELHAHKTREVFDVLDDATGSRRQPLLFIISTEGDSSEGIFPEQVDYAHAVLDSRHQDDSYFSILYTIDQDDLWTEPRAWRKANPNLGVSVFEKDLEIRASKRSPTRTRRRRSSPSDSTSGWVLQEPTSTCSPGSSCAKIRH
jgi:phage terminase large subunit-like protein